MSGNTREAAEELTTAHEYQRKAGRRMACLLMILVIVICVVILAVSYFLISQLTPDPGLGTDKFSSSDLSRTLVLSVAQPRSWVQWQITCATTERRHEDTDRRPKPQGCLSFWLY